MDARGIRTLFADVGIHKMEDNGKWMNLSCPLAPWTHSKGTDSSPSFGVSIVEGGASRYNCFTCKSNGTLSELFFKLHDLSGDDKYRVTAEGLDGQELWGAPITASWEAIGSRCRERQAARIAPPTPLEERIYGRMFESAVGHPYLRRRGISKSTTHELDIRLDPNNHGVPRIVFPVRDQNGGLLGYTGRATTKALPKVRDYFGLPKERSLLGIDRMMRQFSDSPYMIVVEGLFAYARMAQYGYPVVATLGANVTPYQAQLLRLPGKVVYCFYDDDDAGYKGSEVMQTALQGHVPLFGVTYPDEQTNEGDPVSDPDELLKDEVEWMIKNAKIM